MTLRIDPARVEEAAKELYIRALKMLPPDVKRGFDTLVARETDKTAKSVLGVMVRNITVAEQTDNLLCQDTGLPIYNVTIGRSVVVDGVALKAAIRRGCARARALATPPDRSLERHAVDDHGAADGDVVDWNARVLAQQVVRLLRDGDVAYHDAENGLRRGVGLARDQRVEAALDIRRQHLQRADIQLFRSLFDTGGIDS